MNLSSFKHKFNVSSPHIKLIYINICVFVIISLVSVFEVFFGTPFRSVINTLQMPSELYSFRQHIWTIFTYMFVHIRFFHLLFNMLCLYWFGSLFLRNFTSKQLFGLYILGGIFGGLAYIMSYTYLPFFAGKYAVLCGASASIMALIVASAMEMPNMPVRLLLFGEIELKWIAVTSVIVSLLGITSDNAGGEIAHIGGALAGIIWYKLMQQNIDITKPITAILNIFDNTISLFTNKKDVSKKDNPYRNYHYVKSDEEYNVERKQNNRKLDEILDKVRSSGYDSLSEKEKKELFDVSGKV